MYCFPCATTLTSKSTWLPNSAISHSFELGINHERSPLRAYTCYAEGECGPLTSIYTFAWIYEAHQLSHRTGESAGGGRVGESEGRGGGLLMGETQAVGGAAGAWPLRTGARRKCPGANCRRPRSQRTPHSLKRTNLERLILFVISNINTQNGTLGVKNQRL